MDRDLWKRGSAGLRHLSRTFESALLEHRDELAHPDPELAIDIAFRFVYDTLARRISHGAKFESDRDLSDEELVRELARAAADYLMGPEAAPKRPKGRRAPGSSRRLDTRIRISLRIFEEERVFQLVVGPTVEIARPPRPPDFEDRTSRALLLIDARCTSHVRETVARLGASHVTVVAVPRLPALWPYAPLSGHVTVSGMREDAVADAQRVARRVADALPPTCSVEHHVLGAWSDVMGVLQHGAFHTVVLASSPAAARCA